MDGVVAVFFVDEGIKYIEIVIGLLLSFYPPPV